MAIFPLRINFAEIVPQTISHHTSSLFEAEVLAFWFKQVQTAFEQQLIVNGFLVALPPYFREQMGEVLLHNLVVGG